MPKFGPTVHQKHERRNLQSAPSGELIVLFQTSSLGTSGEKRSRDREWVEHGWSNDGRKGEGWRRKRKRDQHSTVHLRSSPTFQPWLHLCQLLCKIHYKMCALAAQKSYRLSHVCYELLMTDVSPDKDLRSEVGSDWLSKVSFSCVKVIKQYGLVRWPVVHPLTSNLGVNSACQASAAAVATDLQFTLPPATWILLPHINQLSRL